MTLRIRKFSGETTERQAFVMLTKAEYDDLRRQVISGMYDGMGTDCVLTKRDELTRLEQDLARTQANLDESTAQVASLREDVRCLTEYHGNCMQTIAAAHVALGSWFDLPDETLARRIMRLVAYADNVPDTARGLATKNGWC